MKIIGLIGGSGCGKSLVASYLTDMGLDHIDCDQIAREVVEPGTPCLAELVEHFGCEILQEDKTLNRKELARRAFSDPEQTLALNRITHKYILASVDQRIQEATSQTGVVVDAAALAESGYLTKCDCVIAVLAPKYKQLRRIMERDDMSLRDARQRLKAQKPKSFYRMHADYVIWNCSDLEHLRCQTKRIYDKIFSCTILEEKK